MCCPISASMLMPLIWMKRGLPSLKQVPGDRAFALVRHHRHLDVGVEDPGLFLPGGGDLDALLLGHHGGGDQVDVRVLRLQHARDHRLVQGGEVHLGHGAVVEDVDRLDRLVRHLADEAAEVGGKLDPGAHHGGLFGGDVRHVQRVLDGAGQKVVRHLLGHLQGDVFLRFGGRGAEVRGADDVRVVEERVFGGGFHLEHVQRRAGDMARVQRVELQRRLVDQPAAGAVDDADALLGLGEVLAATGCCGSCR
jgi:hypothetical protein